MAQTILKIPQMSQYLKTKAAWEIARTGLIWVSTGVAGGAALIVLLATIRGLWLLLFGQVSSRFVIVLSTLIIMLLLSACRRWMQSLVDFLFFPDTAGFLEKVDQACHILPEITTRSELRRLLEDLPVQWQVRNISLHDDLILEARDSLTLPLKMGTRSLGYLTVGPKHSARTFSDEERAALEQFQEQISLVLSGIQLAEAQEAARKTEQLKINFLTNISHQLTTPLNTVINSTGLVADSALGPANEEQQEYLNRAVNGSEYLMRLLNEILDITKIETGQLTLRLEEIDLREVIDDALTIVRAILQNKPVELKVEVADNLPTVKADRIRVRQILLNLLSNAEKFTPHGVIWLRAWPQDDQILISVQDTGIGIARENLPLIFEDYHQVQSRATTGMMANRRRHLGTGLGMPVTRALVELHGGRIDVESELGEGTTFIFTLPLFSDDKKNGSRPTG
jgi:signal transduction histidine kinase